VLDGFILLKLHCALQLIGDVLMWAFQIKIIFKNSHKQTPNTLTAGFKETFWFSVEMQNNLNPPDLLTVRCKVV